MGGEQHRQPAERREETTDAEVARLEHDLHEYQDRRLERAAEKESARPESEQSAEHEAREQARASAEHAPDRTEQRHRSPAERRKDTPSKSERNKAYERLMTDARADMSPVSRSFSTFIHSPIVEKTSDVVGATAARPNALLAGSMMAFFLTLGVYLVARHFGYPLSGFETIAAFIFGWMIGILFDYFRAMATGGR